MAGRIRPWKMLESGILLLVSFTAMIRFGSQHPLRRHHLQLLILAVVAPTKQRNLKGPPSLPLSTAIILDDIIDRRTMKTNYDA